MKHSLLFFAIIFFINAELSARTFYIKSAGNDAASGLSIADAWKTSGKVNAEDFNIKDTILFEGGSTFIGGIYLSEEDSASSVMPLYIGSYGTSRAKIDGQKSFGLYAYNVATVHIDNINFEGLDADSSSGSGIFFYTDNNFGKKYKQIKLSNIDISGFENGIQIGSWNNSYPGYSNIHISKVNASNNLKNGINTYDMAEKTSTLLAHDSLYMDHCYFGNNGFSGVVLGGFNVGIIEHVKASRSGQLHHKGVVGIWCWNSKNIIFQYCVADSTRTDGGDGGGFDIDGGTENCIVQYCYSFNNDGPGYMHCDYPQSRATRNNIIRYNITESDGQQAFKDKSSLAFISWGTGLSNCLIYNNTSFIGNKTNGIITGLQGNILDGFDLAPNMHSNKAFNNLIYAAGDSNYMVRVYNGKAFSIDTSGIKFANNNYFSTKSLSRRWNDGTTNYSSLSDWRTATNHEIYKTKNTGFSINPQLKNAGFGGAIKYSQIDSLRILLQAYTLLKTSGIIDSGMNLKVAAGIDIGESDFFGNAPIFGFSQDIGCNESHFPTAILDNYIGAIKAFPNPFEEEIFIDFADKINNCDYRISNALGQIILSGMVSKNNNSIKTNALPSGIYNLQLQSGSHYQTIKIIKNQN